MPYQVEIKPDPEGRNYWAAEEGGQFTLIDNYDDIETALVESAQSAISWSWGGDTEFVIRDADGAEVARETARAVLDRIGQSDDEAWDAGGGDRCWCGTCGVHVMDYSLWSDETRAYWARHRT